MTTREDPSRQRIAELLRGVGSPRVFVARRTAKVEDLHVEVTGLGQLRLPVSRAQAEQLCRIGRPARYGKGEQTLLDRRVRDTWEIPKSHLEIDRRQWDRTLSPMLDSLRGDLGLPETYRLRAELHAMLVYGPGQFFAPHQDSEKNDDMIGTLVIMLPTPFKGGSFVVEHQGEKITYRGSKERLTCVAFYADCRHEVKPVKAGFRVVLTYNLLLDGEAPARDAAAGVDTATIEALGRCLRHHFETPLPAHRFVQQRDEPLRKPPTRLVYLLDHQYTERGFAWSRLKGNDAARAAALRAAAERSDCELVLALAEIHETWSCFEPGWEEPWRGRHRYWERDQDDEWVEEEPVKNDPDAYELDELVDWGITLDRWIGPSEKKATRIVTRVEDEEVCSTTPSSDLKPYASEYEGYMGNYGNTMDRWYRRAAVIVWPREQAFAARAEASPAWALDELEKLIRRGRLAEAREKAGSLSPFWPWVVGRQEDRTYFVQAVRVAEGLDSPSLAASLLQPFRVEELTSRGVPAFVALVGRYGEDWARRRLSEWSESRRERGRSAGQDQLDAIAALPRLCEALRSADEAVGDLTARALLRDRWTYLREEIESSIELEPPSRRQKWMARLPEPILGILNSSEIADHGELRDEIVSFLCGDDESLVPVLAQLLRVAAGAPAETRQASSALDVLRRHTIDLLRARLEHPERGADDWSIALPAGCGCELCAKLEAFLSNPDQERLEWPLAKQGRKHVHRRLDAHELPIRHETRRSGRPFTLVLSKTRVLFEREARERRSLQADLEWLLAADTGRGIRER